MKREGKVSKDLAYVQETSSFILDFINECALDLHSAFVRISMDGGGPFLKVKLNVLDANKSTKSVIYMNRCVERQI